MIIKIKKTLSVVLLISAGSLQAATLYVKNGGSDSANCTTPETACATLMGAHTKAAVGDEVRIAKGTYSTDACHTSITKAMEFKGGYSNDFSARSTDATSTTIKSHATNVCRLFLIGSGQQDWLVFDTLQFEMVAPADEGAFYTHSSINNGAGAWLHLNNVIAKGFTMASGGLVSLSINEDRLKITNSHIENIKVTGSGGVIKVDGNGVELDIQNSQFINNRSASHGGVVYIAGNLAAIQVKGSVFKKNTTNVTGDMSVSGSSSGEGGVFYIAPDKQVQINITDSHFQHNKARGGAVFNAAGTRGDRASTVTIERSSFIANESYNHGSVIYAEKGLFTIQNSTFSDNIAHGNNSGGAISFNGAKGHLSYNTIFNNKSGAAALGVWYDSLGEVDLLANLIIGNTKNDGITPADIWYYTNSIINDLGYNLVGSNNQHGIVDNDTNPHSTSFSAVFNHKNSNNENTSTVLNILASGVLKPTAYNGGLHEVWSNMPVADGPARNRIPVADDLPKFYGVGQSQTYPFVSLKHAQAVIAQGAYQKDRYYFDLGGSYDAALNFTPGNNSELRFRTVMDENGYLLIASSNPNANGQSYTQVDDLTQVSDRILKSTILAQLEFDEVRISALKGGPRGRFDGYNRSPQAINAIKNFKTLPNASEPGGDQWVVTLSTSGNNYFKGGLRDPGTADGQSDSALNQEIYHSSGEGGGIHWIPRRPNEGLMYPEGAPGSFADELDLWVRISNNLECGVSMLEDGRGMHRPGRMPADTFISRCDIGAFEINDYYQLDCWDDDGFRPENSISLEGVNVGSSWCFNPFDQNVTPEAIFENMGMNFGRFHWIWSIALAGVYLLRKKRLV